MNLVVYWGGVELGFVEIERKKGAKILHIKHHENWSNDNNFLRNSLHHLLQNAKICFQILFAHNIKVFGTNAIRIFFPLLLLKKNVKVVFNELPNNKFPVNVLDRLIMAKLQIFVSSEARRKYFLETYKCDAGILQNAPFLNYPKLSIGENNKKAVYIGLLQGQRFPEFEQKSLLQWLDEHNYTLDVFGKKIGDFEFLLHERVKYFDEVSHKNIPGILQRYSVGIVSYSTEDINNELCAPLKTFDYIRAGLKVFSVNRNVGMCELSEQYPALFNVMGHDSNLWDREYQEQRTLYLDAAIASNINFSD